jgi:two-component system, sensor histidine kinase
LKLNHKPILIAEDNPINKTVVKYILRKWGVKISTADNGYMALKMAAKENYDIILMDLDITVIYGYEAA